MNKMKNDNDEWWSMILTDYRKVLRSTARKIPRSGLVRASTYTYARWEVVPESSCTEGNENICGLIREKGMMSLSQRRLYVMGEI